MVTSVKVLGGEEGAGLPAMAAAWVSPEAALEIEAQGSAGCSLARTLTGARSGSSSRDANPLGAQEYCPGRYH